MNTSKYKKYIKNYFWVIWLFCLLGLNLKLKLDLLTPEVQTYSIQTYFLELLTGYEIVSI